MYDDLKYDQMLSTIIKVHHDSEFMSGTVFPLKHHLLCFMKRMAPYTPED